MLVLFVYGLLYGKSDCFYTLICQLLEVKIILRIGNYTLHVQLVVLNSLSSLQ